MRYMASLYIMMAMLTLICCGNSNDNADEAASAGVFEITPAELSFGSAAGSREIKVTAPAGFSVSSDASWCSCEPIGGLKGENIIYVKVLRNSTDEDRTAKITFRAGTVRQDLSVRQDKAGDEIIVPEGYSLVWNDEFEEGTALDDNWTHEVQGPGWVNNELQTYVNHKSPGGSNVTEIRNGSLMINCFKENGKIYSGRVYAHVNTGWQYGYFEARIKLPSGKGTWPAFWMMPCNVDWSNEAWPKCGEIDIMEEVGCVPNEVSSSLHAEGHNHTNGTQVTHAMTIDKAEGEFHIYAVEWTKDNITTYVDGKVQLSYNNDGGGVRNWPYARPYYIILNLAWGGSWGGMYGVDESALPITMEIDYVRVFQKK